MTTTESQSPISRVVDAGRSAAAWANTERGAMTLVGAFTLLALLLRLWHLGTEPLHVDEVRQVTEVQDTWIRVIRASYGSQQPPLDYLIGKAFITVLPANDFVQRLPAALFGTATVGLAGLVLIREGQRLAAPFAAFFIAISPLHVELSQYARPYALPAFMVVATIAVHQSWRRGRTGWRMGALFAIVAALALLSRASMSMVALAIFGGIALLRAFANRESDNPWRILRSDPLPLLVLPAMFVTVWVPSALRIVNHTDPLGSCLTCDKWAKAAQAVQNFGTLGERALRPSSLVWLLIAVGGVLLWREARKSLAATSLVWAPLLLTAPVFSAVHAVVLPAGELFARRFMVFLPIGLAVYLSIALAAILRERRLQDWRRTAVTFVVGLILASMALEMLGTIKTQAQELDLADWRGVAEHIESIEEPGEVIVSIDARPFFPESFYGFVAAPRYYDGPNTYVFPARTIEHPDWAIDADRYHFVIFVPKMADGWEVPAGWEWAEFSEMMVFSTGHLPDHAARMEAWWVMAQQLRPDVAIYTQIAAAALEAYEGTDLFPFGETALEQAALIGQQEFAAELLESFGG